MIHKFQPCLLTLYSRFREMLCTALILWTASLHPVAAQDPDPMRQVVDDAIAKIKPALVQIYVVTADYSAGREVKNQASGSGVIITEDGHILSNHHVAGRAKRLVCTLANNEEIEAELVGTDPLADISVIKLKGAPGRKYPKADFGNSDLVSVGDTVLAMGSPMALSQSVTKGIVSNTKMVFPQLFWPFDRFTIDGEDVGSIVRWIAHDADIYGGNSGGPLVNLRGEVVGINEIRLGLSGAIPGNLAREVATQLMLHGKVSRSWLGLEVQPMLKHSGQERGVLVSGSIEDSPARAAGFESGDILLRVNGQDVNAHFQEELPLFNRFIADLPVGEELEAVVLRGGQEQTLHARTIEREAMEPRQREIKRWGITVRNISFITAKEMKLSSRDGVLVTSVRPGGPSGGAKPSLEEQDIITSVGDQAVSNVEDLVRRTEEITEGKTEPVPTLIGFSRNTEELVTVIKIGIKEIEDPGLEVKKAWLPIASQVIARDMAQQLGRPDLAGVRITQVYTNSTAEQAGLQVGDLITQIDGEKIQAYQPEDDEVLAAMVRQYPIGATSDLTVVRGRDEIHVPVKLIAAPKLEREMKEFKDEHFEFTARETTFYDKVREELPEDQQGLMVRDVVPGGWAALGHLAINDLILNINDRKLTNLDSLKEEMNRIAAEKPKYVVFSVLRGIHKLYLEIEPNWDEN